MVMMGVFVAGVSYIARGHLLGLHTGLGGMSCLSHSFQHAKLVATSSTQTGNAQLQKWLHQLTKYNPGSNFENRKCNLPNLQFWVPFGVKYRRWRRRHWRQSWDVPLQSAHFLAATINLVRIRKHFAKCFGFGNGNAAK